MKQLLRLGSLPGWHPAFSTRPDQSPPCTLLLGIAWSDCFMQGLLWAALHSCHSHVFIFPTLSLSLKWALMVSSKCGKSWALAIHCSQQGGRCQSTPFPTSQLRSCPPAYPDHQWRWTAGAAPPSSVPVCPREGSRKAWAYSRVCMLAPCVCARRASSFLLIHRA